MKAVWDPRERRVVIIGKKVIEHHRESSPGEKIPYVCPMCGGDAWPVEPPRKDPHFAHRRQGPCVDERLGQDPFDVLGRRPRDPRASKALQALFKADWRRHYAALDGASLGLVPYLHPREFVHILDRALAKDVFSLHGLTEGDIPYVLACLIDFPPERGRWNASGPHRRFWFRFWWFAERAIRTADEPLRPTETHRLFRGSFETPTDGGKPARDDLNKFKAMPVVELPQEASARASTRFAEGPVMDWFSRHPAFGRG